MQAHFERRFHTAEVAELRLARAVAQVSAQMFCPQCSRLHCLAQGAQLNSLKTLLAADLHLRISLVTTKAIMTTILSLYNKNKQYEIQ